MIKKIKLSESDLKKIISRVLNESEKHVETKENIHKKKFVVEIDKTISDSILTIINPRVAEKHGIYLFVDEAEEILYNFFINETSDIYPEKLINDIFELSEDDKYEDEENED